MRSDTQKEALPRRARRFMTAWSRIAVLWKSLQTMQARNRALVPAWNTTPRAAAEREHCLCELPKRLAHHESDKHP